MIDTCRDGDQCRILRGARRAMGSESVAVIGGGIGGLVAALRLAVAGMRRHAPRDRRRAWRQDAQPCGRRYSDRGRTYRLHHALDPRRDLRRGRCGAGRPGRAHARAHPCAPRLERVRTPRPIRRHRRLGRRDRRFRRPARGRRIPPFLHPRRAGVPHPRRIVHPRVPAGARRSRPPRRPVGHGRPLADPALRHPVGSARRLFPRPAAAPAVCPATRPIAAPRPIRRRPR